MDAPVNGCRMLKASPNSSAPAGCRGWLVTCRRITRKGGSRRRQRCVASKHAVLRWRHDTQRARCAPACSACTGCVRSSPQPQSAGAAPPAPAGVRGGQRRKVAAGAATNTNGIRQPQPRRVAEHERPGRITTDWQPCCSSPVLPSRLPPGTPQAAPRLQGAQSGGEGSGHPHLGCHRVQQVPLQLPLLHAGQLVAGVVHQAAHLRG